MLNNSDTMKNYQIREQRKAQSITYLIRIIVIAAAFIGGYVTCLML